MKRYGLYLAWLFALAASLGSLYVSEILYYSPCNLCWYQRICIFPLAIVLGIAAYKRFTAIAGYMMVLPIIGMVLALLQIGMQEIPAFEPLPLCGPGGHCQDITMEFFGFITLPMLSFVNFLLITCFLNSARKTAEEK